MEKKSAKILAVLVVVGLMAAGPVAYAVSEEDNPGSGKSYKSGEGKEFMKELNLTPEQKEKLKTQREAKQASHKAMREQLRSKMQALHEAIARPGATKADVDGLVGEVNALKGQMFSQKIDSLLAMKEVLTPEQFAKMQEKHKKWMDKRHDELAKNDPGSAQD